MRFALIPLSPQNHHSSTFDESMLALAARNGPVAGIWQSSQGLVVTRNYRRYERFNAACEIFLKQSWPISVRLSGGGIVPQGPGIINLSLAYAVAGSPLEHSDSVYQRICRVITQALADYNICTFHRAVTGSFCDGRYNLAVIHGAMVKKVAGTAQVWRTVGHGPKKTQVVLVHAAIMAATDVAAITQQVNLFEDELHSGRRYDCECIASLHQCQKNVALPPADFTRALESSLARQLDPEKHL